MSSTGDSAESSVRIICGPTGAGKSALAMQLAESFGAVIVSADSRQIYRGFDIGTAKPTAADQARVTHRGIDIAEPTERYSAARWARDARTWIDEARAGGRDVVLVGGTGFYLRALTEPLFESPPLDPARRVALERAFATIATDDLRRWCSQLDPDRAHLGRTQLLRALETVLLTGDRLSDLHRTRARTPHVRARYLVVDPGPALAAYIERRFDAMMAAGWPEEVERLTHEIDASAPAWKSSGYEAMRAVVSGSISRSEARERVMIETRQYAKRQRTWFRHQLEPDRTTRLDPNESGAEQTARTWWEGRRTA